MVNRYTPRFPINVNAYHRYLEQVPYGTLILPPYEEESNAAIIYPGEVFCRIPDCLDRKLAFISTYLCRRHVEGHGRLVVPAHYGTLFDSEKDDAVTWYESLFAGNEDGDSLFEENEVENENESQ